MYLFLQRQTGWLALLGVGAGIVLLAIRAVNSISFLDPLQILTSGAEYESQYILWKYVHGLVVYADHFKIPFAGTFYNWLYYAFYGEIIKLLSFLLALDDAWLPTVARLVTLSGAIYGTFITFRCYSDFVPTPNRQMRILCFAFAALIYLGPLTGFFAIAAQPDVWATALDMTAVYFFLKYYRREPARAVAVFAVFALMAWSFKQLFVFSSGAVGLFLLMRRDWSRLFMLIAMVWGGWAVILAIGSPQYVKAVLQFGGSTIEPSLLVMLINLQNLAVKTSPILFGFVAICTGLFLYHGPRDLSQRLLRTLTDQNSEVALALSILLVSMTAIVTLPSSAKLGAAENYYFPLVLFVGLLLVQILARIKEVHSSYPQVLTAIGGGFVLHILAISSVLFGVTGVLSPKPMFAHLNAERQCLIDAKLPEPTFVGSQVMTLPWLYPAEQHFVIQTNYRWDRANGVPMEGGGIGGLIDSGHFASLALEDGIFTYDGADLRNYRPDTLCGQFRIYRRIFTEDKK